MEHIYGLNQYSISADFLYTPVSKNDGQLRWVNKPLRDNAGEPLIIDSHDKAEMAIRKMRLWDEYEKRWVRDEDGKKPKGLLFVAIKTHR